MELPKDWGWWITSISFGIGWLWNVISGRALNKATVAKAEVETLNMINANLRAEVIRVTDQLTSRDSMVEQLLKDKQAYIIEVSGLKEEVQKLRIELIKAGVLKLNANEKEQPKESGSI